MLQARDGGDALARWTWAAANEFDVWLVKTDAEGTPEWNQTYGGTDNIYHDWIYRVATADVRFMRRGLSFFMGIPEACAKVF